MNLNFNKKTISPVIAVVILLLASIISAIYLFDFISEKQTEFHTDFEEKQNTFLGVPEIRDIYNKKLYIYSEGATNYNSISINDVECDSDRNKTLNSGLNEIEINECLSIEELPKRVKISLNYGGKIIEKSDFIRENALTSLIRYLSCDSGVYSYNSIDFNLNSKLGHNSKKKFEVKDEVIQNGKRDYEINLNCNNGSVIFSDFNLNVNCDKKFDLDSSNKCVSYCYNSLNMGKVGTFGVCKDMLIVNNSMLKSAGASPFNGGDESYDILGPDGNQYTFGDSQYNVFTGQVTDMQYLFYGTSFNSSINYWDVSSVTNMQGIFQYALSFNQPLNNWDVSSVTNMRIMLNSAPFNQDVSNWDVSSVTNMGWMFEHNGNFNQDVSNWDVSSVTEMRGMFRNTYSFNQNLTCWNVSKISNKPNNFNIGSALSSANLPIWGTSGIC